MRSPDDPLSSMVATQTVVATETFAADPTFAAGPTDVQSTDAATVDAAQARQRRGGSDPSSLQGIRWLLLVGGLVVAVSVIRLVAAEWHQLSAGVQFLLLIAGALGIFGSAEVLRRRLHLPLAATALHGLFVALVPLLAWGAAHQGLAMTWTGSLVVVPGLLALLGACRHLLRRQLAYDGSAYLWVLGTLLLAVPYLPVAARTVEGGEIFFLVVTGLAGLALRWGSRHINRFFFHRDRRQGVDRPLHLLPFALLLVVYFAAVLALPGALAWIAVPLALAAVALIDCGEEYYRALLEARGEPVRQWPRRSVALLLVGFAGLAVALGLAPLTGWAMGWAVVSLLATWRLLAWGLRYRSTAAYGGGLLVGMMAYHAVPALVPDLARQAYQWLLQWIGIPPGGAAVLSLGGVGLLACLVASAVLFERHSSPQMSRLHRFLVMLQGAVVLAAGLGQPLALRWVALLVLPLMLWAVKALRRSELLPWAYGALALAALAWGWGPGSSTLWSEAGAFLLALVSLLYLGAGWEVDRRLRRRPRPSTEVETGFAVRRSHWRHHLALPVVAVLAMVGVLAGPWLGTVFSAGTAPWLQLLLVPSFALATRLLRWPPLGVPLAVAASLGVWGLALQLPLGDWTLAAAAQLLVVAVWVWERRADAERVSLWRWTSASLMVRNGGVGLFLLATCWLGTGATVEALILLWLGAYLFDTAARKGAFAPRAESLSPFVRWVQPALLLLSLYPTVQLWAWGVDAWTPLVLSFGLTLAALSTVLRRRGGDRLAQWYGVDQQQVRLALEQRWVPVRRAWRLVAAASCLLWVGPWGMALAVWLAAETVGRVRGRSQSPPPVDGKDPMLILTALPFLQLAAWATQWAGMGSDFLLPSLLSANGWGSLATLIALLGWTLCIELLSARGVVRPTVLLRGAEMAVAGCALWGLVAHPSAATGGVQGLHLGHVVAAGLFALWNARCAWTRGRDLQLWNVQGWILLAVFHGFAAEWLRVDAPSALWLMALAVALETWAAWLRRRLSADGRRSPRRGLLDSARGGATAWALLAGGMSCIATLSAGGSWWSLVPMMLASVLFALRARRGEWVASSSALASVLFALGFCLAVDTLPFMGPELYFLGPGIALMLLSWLLAPRIGQAARGHLFTCGAVAAYGTPMMGLLGEVGWIWQCVLLLAAIAFGASSFRLRSRSLLTVSTAALVIDLVFFVVKLRRAEPTLLWIAGIAFGLALMASAAFLEHRREEVEQRLRIWGHELRSWN